MKIQKVFLIVFSVNFLKCLYVQAIGHRLFTRLSFYKKGWRPLASNWHLFAAVISKNAAYEHLCSLHRLTEKHYDYWPSPFRRVSIHNEIPVCGSN